MKQGRRVCFGSLCFGAMMFLFGAPTLVQAQGPEMFFMSYPNADITVDGDASDWNLDQFSTLVFGGIAIDGDTEEWIRTPGQGDIAMLGWSDDESAVFYGGRWSGGVLPEERSDNAVKFYARDNETHQYFLVDIVEDEINTDDEAAWANDSVEFYIDPTGDRGSQAGGTPAWESDVQLVIDAANRVQVWNSPEPYELQVEAGVTSAVTMTDDGWMLEVGIDKSVFATPLPPVLGQANDAAGRNFGIDLSYRDNDDPNDTGTRNGDTEFTSAYIWADATDGGGFPSKLPDNWGQMIAGVVATADCDFDGSGACDIADLDELLYTGLSSGDTKYDLDGNGSVDLDDRDAFLTELGTVPGDFDLDGKVVAGDLNALGGNWTRDDLTSYAQGDANGDGIADAGDLNVLGTNWQFGAEAAQQAAVPEPGSCASLLIGLVGLLGLRKRLG